MLTRMPLKQILKGLDDAYDSLEDRQARDAVMAAARILEQGSNALESHEAWLDYCWHLRRTLGNK